ncbi:unnamed protein product [Arctogadus glacialis]
MPTMQKEKKNKEELRKKEEKRRAKDKAETAHKLRLTHLKALEYPTPIRPIKHQGGDRSKGRNIFHGGARWQGRPKESSEAQRQACFRCGGMDHWFKDFPDRMDKNNGTAG